MKARIIIYSLVIATGAIHISVAQNIRIKLVNCKLEKQVLNDIQNSLAYQLKFYSEIFNQPVDSTFKARIFGTEKEFLKYSKTVANFNPTRTHAIAFYSFNLNEMIMPVTVTNFPRVFAHELSHAILNHYCKDASTWLNEGLSKLLECIVANDSTYYFDMIQLKSNMVSAAMYFREGESIKDAINANNFYQGTASFRNYSMSFAIALYLFHERPGILANIIKSDCSQRDHMFDLYYPGGLDLLAVDVKSWFLNYNPTLK